MRGPILPAVLPHAAPGRGLAIALSLLLSGPLAVPCEAQSQSADIARSSNPWAGDIALASRRFGLPELWIRAVMHAESRGRPHAVSPAQAMGLMQIMPGTWKELRDRHKLGRDPFAPGDNILAGAAYLAELHARFGAPGFLAAYNAGPTRYGDYLERGRPLPAETIAYVAVLASRLGMPGLPGGGKALTGKKDDPARAPLFIARQPRSGLFVDRPTTGGQR